MPTYSLNFIDADPWGILSRTPGGSATWSGPSTAAGSAILTDNNVGAAGFSLDRAGESATADLTLGATSVSGVTVSALESWTLFDTVTGESFQVVTFFVPGGELGGLYYTLSEVPLVNGRVYRTDEFSASADENAGDPVFSYSDYALNTDHLVSGTSGNDTIDASYTGDPQGHQVDDGAAGGAGGNDNVIFAEGGDDLVQSGDGADTVSGGTGADTIEGGDGDDVIEGDGGRLTEVLDWSLEGADGTDISAGFTQTTGLVDVSLTFTDDGNNSPTFQVETSDTIYAESGETYDTASSLFLFGTGDAATSTSTFDFAATTGAPVEDAVRNVSFRISDIDWGSANHIDVVTVTAFDAAGAPTTVTFTPAGNDTVIGNTITAALTAETSADAAGSVLIEIAGPVSQIVVSYSNNLTGTQGINVSDVHFDAIPSEAASADSIDGGAGADILSGQEGADTIRGGTGDDTMSGGAGDDVFELEDGAGTDIITDFDVGDDNSDGIFNDQLDVSGLTDAFGQPINAWDVTVDDDGSGNARLLFPSGDVLVLQGVAPAQLSTAQLLNAAGVPCFVQGTRIRTPRGEVPIEALRPGDGVVTLDHGVQPVRWAGARRVHPDRLARAPQSRPILIPQGVLGCYAPLLVSPLHGLLLGRAHLGEDVLARARHLAETKGPVRIAHGWRDVIYHHLLFDAHEVIFANGAPAESFYPGPQALRLFSANDRHSIRACIPGLTPHNVATAYGPTARPFARRKDVLRHVHLRPTPSPALAVAA